MDELTILLVVLLIVLAVVTVVGHGIWVLLARVFGGPRRPPAQSSGGVFDHAPRECPRCRTPLARGETACAVCNWPRASQPPADGVAALRAIRRQLEVLSQQGTLDAEARAQLNAVVNDQERRLIGQLFTPAQPTGAAEVAAAASTAPTEEVVAPETVTPAAASELAAVGGAAAISDEAAAPRAVEPLPERARKYAASRAVAIEEARAEPIAPAEPPKQREALSRLFAAFMEEKNIRWGELVGGLLIVGCSIALVISFWSQIDAQPPLKFVLFNGVTAALFGVGVYTDRRWKIHTTSHGLLAMATLLVPLNFLVIARFTQVSPATDAFALTGEGLSLAVSALLVFFAGRILVPGEPALLAAGVIVPCLVQLLVGRFAGPTTPLAQLYAFAAVPIAAYLLTTSIVTRKRWLPLPLEEGGGEGDSLATAPAPASSLPEIEANRVLLFLGLATAAALMPLALLLHNVPPILKTLHWLSPLAAVCGLPALLAGLLFWRRLTDRAHSSLQTAGIAVGVLGALILIGAVVAAWPTPVVLLPTALAAAAAMLTMAVVFGIPAAHIPAGVAVTVAWLVAFFGYRQRIDWWILDDATSIRHLFLSAKCGHALVPMVAVFGGLAAGLYRIGRREAGKMYGFVGAATAILSLGLVFRFGFGYFGDFDDPYNATSWTLAIYSLAAFVLALVLHRVEAAYAASALLLATLGQTIVYHFNPTWQLAQPWIVVLLTHATLVAVTCAVLQFLSVKFVSSNTFAAARRLDILRGLAYSALATSFAAAAWLAATSHLTMASTLSIRLVWLGVVWLVLAVLHESPALVTASQIGFVIAIVCGVTAAVESRRWYAASPHPWLDPWFLEAQGIALAAYCLVLGVIRWLIGRELTDDDGDVLAPAPPHWVAATARLIQPPWPGVDQMVSIALAVLMVVVATYAVLPGAAQELSPTEVAGDRVVTPVAQFEVAAIPHSHAADRGAWLLLLAVAIALTPRLAQRVADWRRIGLLAIGMVMCLLLAARFESQVAVASALRWLAAGLLAASSAAAWILDRKTIAIFSADADATPSVGGVPDADTPSTPSSAVRFAWLTPTTFRDSLVAFNALIYVAMCAYIVQAALARTTMHTGTSAAWFWSAMWLVFAGLATAFLFLDDRFSRVNSMSLTRRPSWAWATHSRWMVLLAAIAPLAILLTFTVAKTLDGRPLVGPDHASWFRQIGFEALYGVPLVLVALTFIGYAIVDRSSPFAFAAGLLFNVVATIVVLLRLARGGGVLDAVAWITVAQINAIVAGIVAIVWHVAASLRGANARLRRDESSIREARPRVPLFLVTQVALATALCGSFLIPAVARLAIEWSPRSTLPAWVAVGGSPAGWCAVALAIVAALWLAWRRGVNQLFVAAIAAALAGMIALAVLRQGRGDVPAYHTLLAGCCIAAWLVPVATPLANRLLAPSSAVEANYAWSGLPARAFDVAAVWLALWEYSTAVSWWIVLALVAIGLRNIAIAWREGRRGSMWIAAVLIAIATSAWWLDLLKKGAAMGDADSIFTFLWVNVLVVAVLAVTSVWIERRHALARSQPADRRWLRGIAFHRFAAWAIAALLLLTTAAGLIADLSGDSFPVNQLLAWTTWAAAVVVAAACLWDPAIRWPVPCLYCVGLIAVGIYLDGLDLHSPFFHWALANALASYSLATSGLWSVRDRFRDVLARLGVPVSASLASRRDVTTWSSLSETATADVERPATTFAGEGHGWLVTINILIGFFVLLLVAWIEMEQTKLNAAQRMVAAYAVGAQAVAIGLLARGAVRTSLQYLSLVWGVLFAVAFGWAWVPPGFAAPWLHRLIVTAAALAAVVVLYGFGLVKFLKRENEWTRAAAKLVPALALLAAVLVMGVLAIETRAYLRDGRVRIALAALITIIVALAGLVIAALVAALVPGRDPLGLSERGRTLYVYLAEVLAALLFLHVRVTMPSLFSGWFMRFWPLVVMALAFVGVGFGELFRRRKQQVLSEPLENTGAILPLLPALGFWVRSVRPSEVDYSLLLLSVGVLYAALSILRRSFASGVWGGVAPHGSLWYLLHRRDGLDFLEHPQLWLIPPALCALAAGYINRERLTAQQSSALRYAAAIVIYISSTADIFISGVAEAPWLPGVLAGFSIFGVLMGILLRVRAFLYLGTAFLVVALMTIIWHAAEGHTWVWWLAGIVMGVLIITLFGVFEKRRDDVLRVVEELKHWQA